MDKEEEKRVVNKFTQQWALLKTVVVNSLEFFKGEFLKKRPESARLAAIGIVSGVIADQMHDFARTEMSKLNR